MKMKSYKGGDLKGDWLFTRKVDGVNVFIDSKYEEALSKNNKQLHNFESIFKEYPTLCGYFECFDGSWEESITLTKRKGSGQVTMDNLYPIGDPFNVDKRLVIYILSNPSEDTIMHQLMLEIQAGYEGLVLYNTSTEEMIKVKPSTTIDIRVTGIQLGTGKYTGMIGALLTKYGKVGTGLKDSDRCDMNVIGSIIEVEFMGWTPKGKMRHPRLKRFRPDKNEENLER